MRQFIRQPYLWLTGYGIWSGTLWWLSSRVHHLPPELSFQFSDKILHFGYFFGGGILFSAFLFRLEPGLPRWNRIILLTVVTGGLIGAIDEWHQTKVPGRSGNDPADFTADLLGAVCGALALRKSHRVIA